MTISSLRKKIGKANLSRAKRTGYFTGLGRRPKNGGKWSKASLKPNPGTLCKASSDYNS
jgi:hypothetical protein